MFQYSIYSSAVLLLDVGRFFSFLILYTVGRTPSQDIIIIIIIITRANSVIGLQAVKFARK
jgi:hypothetical protein